MTTITYKVYYSPSHVVERTYTFDSTDDSSYYLYSNKGSNTLDIDTGWFFGSLRVVEDTTAPIEVVSFIKTKRH